MLLNEDVSAAFRILPVARARKTTRAIPACPAFANISFKHLPAIIDSLREWMEGAAHTRPEWRK